MESLYQRQERRFLVGTSKDKGRRPRNQNEGPDGKALAGVSPQCRLCIRFTTANSGGGCPVCNGDHPADRCPGSEAIRFRRDSIGQCG
ncbi:hypothetical protein T12_217 [Trichinella patagoniensis]|uniref:Uncharacterized protein n=1 Tax=Trichinella patagoniensis TaxID=990121 RepID=A0A0V0Z8T6_9BILA|nr:hypothetical protein T12_217 [Trichinella patagoniensis]